MRTLLVSFLAIAAITVAADIILSQAGFSASERESGDAVRLN